MTWRVARSLDQLLAQLNALAPNRSRASDGSIGDSAHQVDGSASDHNPWYGPGIVTARDFTHDPGAGLDCNKLAAALIASRDPRIKYIIWQGRICDSRPQFWPWTWQPSAGHYQHLHLSVMDNATADDARPWVLPGLSADPLPATKEDDVALTSHTFAPGQKLLNGFAVPPVGGSISIPAGTGEAWLHLRCPRRPVTVHGMWFVRANGSYAAAYPQFQLPQDTYSDKTKWRLPHDCTQVTVEYSGDVPIFATLETKVG